MLSTNDSSARRPGWSATSWRSMPVHAQQAVYEDDRLLEDVLSRLAGLPPLVDPDDVEAARAHYAAAARGEAFLLVGGDCAESFDDTKDHIIGQKMNLLANQARHIESTTGVTVHITARLAGQYSKPRSQLMETLPDGRQVHAFRGHNINGAAESDRKPDPKKLLHGWWHSLAVLHKLKSSSKPIATAHEALHLPLETALTKGRYNTSATFLWVGERTRQLDGAHLEYARGLRNPLGVKIGPTTTPEQVLAVLGVLCGDNPNEPGRVTLIPRLGADQVSAVLPPILRAVQSSPFNPVWMCDPCHGNTFSHNGAKTRCPTTMLREVAQVVTTLADHSMHLGGIHLEQTGEEVVECVDKSVLSSKEGVELGGESYKSLCDPRLSGSQALAFVEGVAELLVANGTVEKRGTKSQEQPMFLLPMLERAVRFFSAPFASKVS